MTLTYEQAKELYPIVSRRPENKVILGLIADAIMREKIAWK